MNQSNLAPDHATSDAHEQGSDHIATDQAGAGQSATPKESTASKTHRPVLHLPARPVGVHSRKSWLSPSAAYLASINSWATT